ncbi:hypothetical protein F5Y14DRAFT_446349 [Nemania sp. NC0429]|nr:hypothetical protein F5Y14DRAFT_446349 [Nemania sp. NC0429]
MTLFSYAILFLGALTPGLAPTLAGFVLGLLLMAVGSGFGSLSKSLMSIYVDPAHRSRLFSLVGMVEVLGSVFSQPLLAGLFSLGLRCGGTARGSACPTSGSRRSSRSRAPCSSSYGSRGRATAASQQ